jgi:rhodanese-related sulfurtransferase
MSKKTYPLFALMIVFSLLLGACAPSAPAPVAPAVEPPAVVVTDAPVAAAPQPTKAPTEAPAEAPAPPEVSLDFEAIFSAIIADMPPDKAYGSVKVTSLNEEIVGGGTPFLVDVREPAEIEKDGFLEGAISIPVRSLLKNLDKLPGLDQPIVIYCASGHRGGLALAALKAIGYTQARNLNGGLNAWKKAELPVVTNGSPAEAKSISTPIVENEALFTAFDEYLSNLPDNFNAVKADAFNEELVSGEVPFIVDVRSADEWNKDGYLEGSVNIPLPEFMANLDQLPKDEPILILCASGHRGAVAQAALHFLGYENVRNLNGGLNAWKAAQFPVVGFVDWQVVWKDFFNSLPEGFYTIKADVLNSKLAEEPPFIVDVREAAEIEKDGFITGSIHIPVREVLKNLDKLPGLDEAIVVTCASGHRGAMVMGALRLLGYTDVVNLNGGLNAWKKAEFAVETGTMPDEPVAGTAPEVDQARFAALDAYLSNLPEGFVAVKAPDLNTELAENDLVLLDIRTEKEVTGNGYIDGSVFLPVNTLLDDMSVLPGKSEPTILVCQSGHRGGLAIVAMNMLGWTDVRNLNGGVNAWAAAELPLVK